MKVAPTYNHVGLKNLQIPIYLSHPLFYINKRLRKQRMVEKHAIENSPIDKISNILYNVVTNPEITNGKKGDVLGETETNFF